MHMVKFYGVNVKLRYPKCSWHDSSVRKLVNDDDML